LVIYRPNGELVDHKGRGIARRRPTRALWRYLGQDHQATVWAVPRMVGERVLVSTPMHWLVACKEIFAMSATVLVGLVISVAIEYFASGLFWIQVGIWLVMVWHLCALGHKILLWRADLLIVTTHRMIRTGGVFTDKIGHVVPHRVTHYDLYRSFWGRVLNYGTFRVQSAGQHNDGATDEYHRFVPKPKIVYYAAINGASLNLDPRLL
jgi:hypothetical protein